MITIAQLLNPQADPPSTLDQPLEHLVACHRRIEERLATLERAVAVLETNKPEALETIRNITRFMDSNGVLHRADEEESLFPRLRSRAVGSEAAFLDRLEADHKAAEAFYVELKAVVLDLERVSGDTSGLAKQSRELVDELCAVYRRHIREEDTTLIAMARRLLSEGEFVAIAIEMKAHRGQTV